MFLWYYYDSTKLTNPHKKVWNDVGSYYFENKYYMSI